MYTPSWFTPALNAVRALRSYSLALCLPRRCDALCGSCTEWLRNVTAEGAAALSTPDLDAVAFEVAYVAKASTATNTRPCATPSLTGCPTGGCGGTVGALQDGFAVVEVMNDFKDAGNNGCDGTCQVGVPGGGTAGVPVRYPLPTRTYPTTLVDLKAHWTDSINVRVMGSSVAGKNQTNGHFQNKSVDMKMQICSIVG